MRVDVDFWPISTTYIDIESYSRSVHMCMVWCMCARCGVYVIVCAWCGVYVIVCAWCGVCVIVCARCGVCVCTVWYMCVHGVVYVCAWCGVCVIVCARLVYVCAW